MRIFLVVASCLLSVLIGLTLSHRDSPASLSAPNRKPVIGLSLDTLKEERWQTDRNLFENRVKALGAETLIQSANGDDTRQIADVQALISRHIDVLVIVPHNGEAMAKAVALAHEAGIPVLSYDRLITGCDLDLYITFDNVKVGELQAQYLVDHVTTRPLRLIRIYGSKTDNNALLFKQGQDNVLQPLIQKGDIQVVHEDWAQDWRPENAKKITNAAITKVGDKIDAILASNDGTAGGAIQALIEEGVSGKITVTGQDAELPACQRIVNGQQAMTIYKPIAKLANQAAETAVKLAKHKPVIAPASVHNGHSPIPSILLDVTVVTKENMAETVIKDGFHPQEKVYQGAAGR
ncbi:MAG: substrate-binding domain-containing protein [Verrucomicrobiota bacterium]